MFVFSCLLTNVNGWVYESLCQDKCTHDSCGNCAAINLEFCPMCIESGCYMVNSASAVNILPQGQIVYIVNYYYPDYTLEEETVTNDATFTYHPTLSIAYSFTLVAPSNISYSIYSNLVRIQSNYLTSQNGEDYSLKCDCECSFAPLSSELEENFLFVVMHSLQGDGGIALLPAAGQCSGNYVFLNITTGLVQVAEFENMSLDDRQMATFSLEFYDTSFVPGDTCLICAGDYYPVNGVCTACSLATCSSGMFLCTSCIDSSTCCNYDTSPTNVEANFGKSVLLQTIEQTMTLMLYGSTGFFEFVPTAASTENNIFVIQDALPFRYTYPDGEVYEYDIYFDIGESYTYISIEFASRDRYLTCEVEYGCTSKKPTDSPYSQIFKMRTGLKEKEGVSFESMLFPGKVLSYFDFDTEDLLYLILIEPYQSFEKNATFKLLEYSCQPGEQIVSGACSCASAVERNSMSFWCIDLLPFCTGCNEELKCCSNYLYNDQAVNNDVFLQNVGEKEGRRLKIDSYSTSDYLNYKVFSNDNFDPQYLFQFEPYQLETTQVYIKALGTGQYIYCHLINNYFQCDPSSYYKTVFIIYDGLVTQQGISLSNSAGCYLGTYTNTLIISDCTGYVTDAAKTWKVIKKPVAYSSFDSRQAAIDYSPIFYFHEYEERAPISIDDLNLQWDLKQQYTFKISGETHIEVPIGNIGKQYNVDQSKPVYYNIREDSYYVYISYALVFISHSCGSEFHVDFNFLFITGSQDLPICFMNFHEGDIEFTTLVFTKAGELDHVMLTTQGEDVETKWVVSDFDSYGKRIYVYAARGTHSLYPTAEKHIYNHLLPKFLKQCFVGYCIGIEANNFEDTSSSDYAFNQYPLKCNCDSSELTSEEVKILQQYEGKIGLKKPPYLNAALGSSIVRMVVREVFEIFITFLESLIFGIPQIKTALFVCDGFLFWSSSSCTGYAKEMIETVCWYAFGVILPQYTRRRRLYSLSELKSDFDDFKEEFLETEGVDSFMYQDHKNIWNKGNYVTDCQTLSSQRTSLETTTANTATYTTYLDLSQAGYECFENDDCQLRSKSRCENLLCYACTNNTHCEQFGNSSSCSSGYCQECTTHSECLYQTKAACKLGACSYCTKDDHCSHFSSTPYCNFTSGNCIDFKCFAASDCTDASLSDCDLTSNQCIGCSNDTSCEHISGLGICFNSVCISECTIDGECATDFSCTNGKCEQCSQNSDCSAFGLSACVNNTCKECSIEVQCSDISNSFCNDYYCEPCSDNFHCLLFEGLNACDVGTGTCMFYCDSDDNCTSIAAPQCDISTNQCTTCTTDASCAKFDGYEICNAGVCEAECAADSDCSGTDVCGNGKCYQCVLDSDCQSNFFDLYACYENMCHECSPSVACSSKYSPYCDSANYTCEFCSIDEDCTNFPSSPTCSYGYCTFYCSTNSTCEANEFQGDYCDMTYNTCYECSDGIPCTRPQLSWCFYNQCFSCWYDSDCSQFEGRPYCGYANSTFQCVQCDEWNPCSSGYVCDEGFCYMSSDAVDITPNSEDSSDDSSTCFHKSTLVTRIEENELQLIPLSEVQLFDKLLSFDKEAMEFYTDEVIVLYYHSPNRTAKMINLDYLRNGVVKRLSLAPQHYVYVERKFDLLHIPAASVELGDDLMAFDKALREMNAIKIVTIEEQVVPLEDLIMFNTASNTFVGEDGLLLSCKSDGDWSFILPLGSFLSTWVWKGLPQLFASSFEDWKFN